jgi:coatomer subunit beta'
MFKSLGSLEGVEMAAGASTKGSAPTESGMRVTVVVGKMIPNTTNSVFKIQRQLFARSERVKGIDFHPVEPWILTTLYSGMLNGASHISTPADTITF